MVSSGDSGYHSYSGSEGHMVDGCDLNIEDEFDFDTWPEQLFDTGDTGITQPNPAPSGLAARHGSPAGNSCNVDELREGEDVLWFELGPEIKGDTDLEMLYPNDDERLVATLGRDLHVVIAANIRTMVASSDTFKCHEKTFCVPSIRKPDKVTDPIADVTNSLNRLLVFLEGNQTGKEPNLGPSSSTQPFSASSNSLLHKFPTNLSGVCLSKLIARYTTLTQSLPGAVLEIPDYCVSKDSSFSERETIYVDSGGCVIFRKDMRTLDIGVVIVPIIISAWSRVLSDMWMAAGIEDRICLDVVDKDNLLPEHDMIDHWVSWIGCHTKTPSEKKPDLIFIPLFKSNHHNLLVVNFLERKIWCIDTVYREDTSAWEELTGFILHCLIGLLVTRGDSRGPTIGDFEFQVFNPSWSSYDQDLDSGISVMYMMETFIATPSFIKASLREDHIRATMRISYITNIVMSDVNVRKMKVYAAAAGCVEDKCHNRNLPSQEVTEYREQFS